MDVIKTHIARVEQRDKRPVGRSGIAEILVSKGEHIGNCSSEDAEHVNQDRLLRCCKDIG